MAAGALALSVSALWHPAQAEAPLACDAANPNQVRLQISVTGMRSTDGNVTVTIYPDEPSHFLDGAYKLARQAVPVTLPVTQLCFAFAQPGFYAVALFHDENGNGHFDTTLLGLPAEGFGFSNNPTLYLGPPNLSQVRIATHLRDNPIPIQMKYY
jgi:uncharacterized protein (DUF2141 family)